MQQLRARILTLACFLGFCGFLWLAGCESGSSNTETAGRVWPRQSYGAMVERVVAFLKSDKGAWPDGNHIPQPTKPYFYSLGLEDETDELAVISFPAYTCYVAIEAFLRYYAYSGDEECLDRAVEFGEWVLANLTPGTALLTGLPYSTQYDGVMGGGADGTSIETDKAAMFALGLLRLFDVTSNPTFYDAAKHIADTLLTIQKPDGSWAFRVIPYSGEVYRDYTSNQIYFVRLMERMFAMTGTEAYGTSAEKAWDWILDHPVATKYWANFYEDVDDANSLINVDTMETIRELLARRDEHPTYLSLALENFQWIEDTFLLLDDPYPPMIPSIAEQTGFAVDGILVGTSSSTAQWASLGLDVYEATQDPLTLRNAVDAANVVASAQQPDGRMFTATADANGAGLHPLTWYEQCFVPLYFMLDFMGKRPETAPADENHLLRTSAPVRSIVYGPDRITYETTGPGTELFRLSNAVQGVRAGGTSLPPGSVEQGDGWAVDEGAGLLRVRHTETEVEVLLAP